MNTLDRLMADLATRKRIVCPHCGDDFEPDWENNMDGLVTWYAEDGPVEVECMSEGCGRSFWVLEWVTREYGIGTTREEANSMDFLRYKEKR